MFTDSGSQFFVDGTVAITRDQAKACIRLLVTRNATDLVDMLIDPDQISDGPPPAAPQPRCIRGVGFAGRRVA